MMKRKQSSVDQDLSYQWRNMFTLDTSLQFQCSICAELFFSITELEQHEARSHGTDLHKTCSICDQKRYVSWQFPSNCIPVNPEEGHVNMFTCKLCRADFCSEENLAYHNLTAHINEETLCKTCNKVFPNNFLLQKHIKSHLRNENK